MSKPGMIGRGLFAATVACALSVGVTQVFASPPVAERGVCTGCNRMCVEGGWSGGRCNTLDGICECI